MHPQVDNYGPKTCSGGAATSANPATSSARSAGASVGTGAIAGIVVGVCALLAVVAALACFFVARRRRSRSKDNIQPLHLLPMHKHYTKNGKVGITRPLLSDMFIETGL